MHSNNHDLQKYNSGLYKQFDMSQLTDIFKISDKIAQEWACSIEQLSNSTLSSVGCPYKFGGGPCLQTKCEQTLDTITQMKTHSPRGEQSEPPQHPRSGLQQHRQHPRGGQHKGTGGRKATCVYVFQDGGQLEVTQPHYSTHCGQANPVGGYTQNVRRERRNCACTPGGRAADDWLDEL